MGIRAKTLLGFLILAVMLCIAGVWSVYELRSLGTSVERILDDNYKSIIAAKRMTEALEREDSAVLLLLLGKWEEGRSIMESADSSFQTQLEIAKNNVTVPGEKTYIDEIESKYGVYKRLWIKPIVGTRHERDLHWYLQEIHKAFLEVKTSVERLTSLNDETMYRTASKLKERAHRAVMPGIVAILSALVFTLIFNYFVNYYVVSPIIRLTKGIRRFLETREPLDIKIETKDELMYLANSIRELVALQSVGDKIAK